MIKIIDSFGNERIGFIVNEKLWKDYTYAGEQVNLFFKVNEVC